MGLARQYWLCLVAGGDVVGADQLFFAEVSHAAVFFVEIDWCGVVIGWRRWLAIIGTCVIIRFLRRSRVLLRIFAVLGLWRRWRHLLVFGRILQVTLFGRKGIRR